MSLPDVDGNVIVHKSCQIFSPFVHNLMAANTAQGFLKVLPPIFQNTETQVALLGFLSVIGAWVVITKIVQILLSIIWPIMILGGVMLVMPNHFIEACPRYAEMFMENLKRTYEHYAANSFYTKRELNGDFQPRERSL